VDLKGIQLVVQYGIRRLTLASAWQRIGRGGRGQGETAHALFLVEKKYCDLERQAQAKRAVERAAKKCKGQSDTAGTLKRQKKLHQPATTSTLAYLILGKSQEEQENVEMSMIDAPSVTVETHAQRRNRYFNTSTSVNGKKVQVLDAAIDNFVNAQHRGLKCRRAVAQLYFANNERAGGESSWSCRDANSN
jgi:hypothetical protein